MNNQANILHIISKKKKKEKKPQTNTAMHNKYINNLWSGLQFLSIYNDEQIN